MGGAAGAARLQGGSRAEGGGRVVLVGEQREAWRGGGAPWRQAKAEEVPAKSTGLFAGKLPTKSTGVEERRRRTAAAGSGESEAESGGGGKSRIV